MTPNPKEHNLGSSLQIEGGTALFGILRYLECSDALEDDPGAGKPCCHRSMYSTGKRSFFMGCMPSIRKLQPKNMRDKRTVHKYMWKYMLRKNQGSRARRAAVFCLAGGALGQETWPFALWPYLYLRLTRSEDIWVPLIIKHMCS